MVINRNLNNILSIETGAFAVLALYCVVQHLFAYNYAVGNVPYIPLMYGGYIYLSYFVGAVFILRLTSKPLSPKVMHELAMVALFMFIVLLVVLLSDEKARSYRVLKDRSVMQANLGYITSHVLAFIVGLSLRRIDRFKSLIVVGFFLLAGNAFMNFDSKNMLLNWDVRDESHKGIYLMMGDSFGLWAVLACSVLNNRLSRIIIVIVSVVSLAVLHSRTSLYAFIVTIPFVFRLKPKLATAFIAATVAGVMFLPTSLIGQEGIMERILGSVISGEDSSAKWRLIQFRSGLSSIADHWLLGDYAGQVRDFGEIGAYMHNILSYWRQFGLAAFLMLMTLLWFAIQRARRCFKIDAYWEDPDKRFFVMSLVFIGVEVLTSRSYGFSMLWLILGQSTTLAGILRYREAESKCLAGPLRMEEVNAQL